MDYCKLIEKALHELGFEQDSSIDVSVGDRAFKHDDIIVTLSDDGEGAAVVNVHNTLTR